MRRPIRDQRGFALVITLLVTALLVALSVEFVEEVFVDTTLAHNFVAGQQAGLLAASGVDGGAALLKYTLATQGYTSLADPWAKPLHLEDERGSLTVTVTEENGKLNLNKVVPPAGRLDPANFYYLTAQNLLRKQKLPTDLLEGLVDWLDGNDEPQAGGAESAYYGNLKPPYRAKNAPLDTLDELALVKGFSPDLVRQLAPYVTIYGTDANAMAGAPVNINTAPRELLAALQYGTTTITEAMADRIIAYRKVTPFQSVTELGSVPGIDAAIASGLGGYITTTGSVFRVRSEARVGETVRVAEAVMRVSGLQSTLLYWREY